MRARTILLIAGLGMILYGYPGLMSADSADQLDQARRWSLGDWHPPVMALLWRMTELAIAGPFGMLLIQVTGFVVGAYHLLRTELSPRRAAICVLAIGWFPPVLVVFGVIWKDSQMAAFALLGFAGLLSASRRVRWLAVAALVIASAMRHNAVALTFMPIVLLWGRHLAVGRVRRVAYAVALWIAITAASMGINMALAHNAERPFTSSLAVTDIVGTIRWAPPIPDDELRALLAGAQLRAERDVQQAIAAAYTTKDFIDYINRDPVLAMPGSDAEHAAIARAWRDVITTYPAAYLHYRWEVFARLIRLGDPPEVPLIWTGFMYRHAPELAERLGHDASKSSLQRIAFRWVRTGGVFYLPYIYLVVALCLVPLAWRVRPALAVLGSGIAYQLFYFFVAPAADWRYSHWLVVTTLLACVLVFVTRWRTGLRSARPPDRARTDAPAPPTR